MRRIGGMRVVGGVAIFVLAVTIRAPAAADEETGVQDQELLEFLGSFDAMDEDWLVVSIEDMAREKEEMSRDGEKRAEATRDED